MTLFIGEILYGRKFLVDYPVSTDHPVDDRIKDLVSQQYGHIYDLWAWDKGTDGMKELERKWFEMKRQIDACTDMGRLRVDELKGHLALLLFNGTSQYIVILKKEHIFDDIRDQMMGLATYYDAW